VLVTSQSPAWDAIAACADVGVLSRPESIALLSRRAPGLDDGLADELAAELGDLPLALAQAVGYLSQTRITPAAYLAKFRGRRRQILLNQGDDPLYSGRIDTAWSLSFEQLETHAPATMQLLQLCALLAAEPIPLSLFLENAELLEQPLSDICADRHPDVDLDDVVGAALQYSLARRRRDTVQLHRLVQAVISGHLNDERRKTLEHMAARLLTAAKLGAPEDRSNWQLWAQIVPHLLSASALANVEEDDDLRRRLDDAGWYLFWRGDAATRRRLYEDSYRRRLLSLGPDHRDTLASAGGLAYAMSELGGLKYALELQQDTYDRCRRVLGPEDRETLYAANALAIFLDDNGEHQRARELHEETFQRRCRLLGRDHPETLYSANRLAGVLRDLGDNAQARVLFEDTYKRCQRILGEDNIETLNVAGRGLANALDDLGDHDRARRLRQDIYHRCLRVFGPQHPVTNQLRHELP
jgi:Tetratricopeptide repeat